MYWGGRQIVAVRSWVMVRGGVERGAGGWHKFIVGG